MRLINLFLPLLIVGCGADSSSGSSNITNNNNNSVIPNMEYKSCKIINSGAIFDEDVAHDLKQCWNPKEGVSYTSKYDALQWCAREVNQYMSDRYIFGHSITYAVETTPCPTVIIKQ